MAQDSKKVVQDGKSPLPPSFPMENWRESLGLLKASNEVKSKVRALLEAHLSKGNNVVCYEGVPPTLCFLWKPHNYRLKIPIKAYNEPFFKKNFPKEIKRVGRLFPLESVVGTSGNQLHISKGKLIFEVNPDCVIIIYKSKEWFKVKSRAFEGFVDGRVAEILSLMVCGLKALDLGFDFDYGRACWVRQENTLKGEEFLDNIPKKLVVDDTAFKKVYQDDKSVVEFKDASFMKSYIKNRVLEDFGAYESRIKALEEFISGLEAYFNPYDYVKANVKGVQDILIGGWLKKVWDRLDAQAKDRLFNEVWG